MKWHYQVVVLVTSGVTDRQSNQKQRTENEFKNKAHYSISPSLSDSPSPEFRSPLILSQIAVAPVIVPLVAHPAADIKGADPVAAML